MSYRRDVALLPAAGIIPRRPRWAWEERIPLGAVTLLVGREGTGKTTLSTALAAPLTRGTLAGDLHGQPASVIYASAEDSLETTLVPRFTAAHGDLKRLHFVDVQITEGGEAPFPDALTLPDDTARLGELATGAGARLIVLDPLVSFLPESVNAHRDQHVRRVLAPLARMASDQALAIAAIVHLNKGDSHDVLARVSGSVGFPAAARSVLVFARDPDDPDGENGASRILAHAKCNLGPHAPSLRARIESRTIRGADNEPIGTSALVLGATAEQTARDLLAAAGVGGEEATARSEARDFLTDELANGPRPVTELRDAAEGAGLSWRTVERGKKQLGVRARKTATVWMWELPAPAEKTTNKPAIPNNPPDGLVGLDGLDGPNTANTANTAKAASLEDRGALAALPTGPEAP